MTRYHVLAWLVGWLSCWTFRRVMMWIEREMTRREVDKFLRKNPPEPCEPWVQVGAYVAAEEREACAKIADAEADSVSPPTVPFDGGVCDAGRKIAARIRARRNP